MSYAIENLKFTIFGHGHDYTRLDSGSGSSSESLDVGVKYAVIDDTETYVWLRFSGYGHVADFEKYNIREWTRVETDIDSGITQIYHPTNIANNIGIGFKNGYAYIFDLTNDSIINEGQVANVPTMERHDCILVGDVIYLCSLRTGVPTNLVYWFDTTDMSSGSFQMTRTACCGFVSDNLMYCFRPAQVVGDYKRIFGIDGSGNTVWDRMAQEQGVAGFENVNMAGFGKNGKIYVPTYIGEAWKIGEYDASSAPNFDAPNPSKTLGQFNSNLDLIGSSLGLAYSNERTRAVFVTTLGVLYTDFNICEILSESADIPLACSDKYIICSDTNEQSVIIYR